MFLYDVYDGDDDDGVVGVRVHSAFTSWRFWGEVFDLCGDI